MYARKTDQEVFTKIYEKANGAVSEEGDNFTGVPKGPVLVSILVIILSDTHK